MKYCNAVTLLGCALVVCVAVGAPSSDRTADTNLVAIVTSGNQLDLEYGDKVQILYLRGNVVVRYPEGELKADNAVIEKDSKPTEKVEGISAFVSVMAVGNVRLTSGSYVAIGNKAVWTRKDRRIVLTGDKEKPMVRQGPAMYITAERIIYLVDSQKFEFQPKPVLIVKVDDETMARFDGKSAGAKKDETKKPK